ncbi:MAG: glutamate-1-semialdehyde 2,1-aminomutase [Nitrospirae bacterium]|nr:glutamate-1-semialdehyde 2,1-aminomutase [Nitrospirota bacterium]
MNSAGPVSRKLFGRAVKIIPGGVNSPVRAFKSVGGNPLFIARARGSKVIDADGRTFIDYVLSWGPMILGHAPRRVVDAVRRAGEAGFSFGAPTEGEVRLAEEIVRAVPSIEMVRLVNSGTEATMSALRLARAFTRREKIVKFAGGYHGHDDSLLVAAGSGATTFGVPDSPGVTRGTARDTIILPFNDSAAARETFRREGKRIAAVIVEPVPGNMGVVVPKAGFLEGLRRETKRHGSLLIFDEVMTGFRLARGGAQSLFGIEPDLTCLGKVIGGGLPIGAYGGRRDIMKMIAPSGPVYQAGTLAGNPLAVAAGIEMLGALREPGFYRGLDAASATLEEGLRRTAAAAGVPVSVARVGSMFTVFFSKRAPSNYDEARKCDTGAFGRFFGGMLRNGVFLPPSQFEAAFLSAAHTSADIRKTLRAARAALREV